MKLDSKQSLKLSLMPSIFAAGCCATAPLMSFFGFSYVEYLLTDYVWYIRGGGVVLLGLSVAWYFYKQGIRSKQALRENKVVIAITVIQTIIVSLILYGLFVFVLTPIIAESLGYQLQDCCSL
mgnify:CR=1 FL=1